LGSDDDAGEGEAPVLDTSFEITPIVEIRLFTADGGTLLFEHQVSERLARELVLTACSFATTKIQLSVFSDFEQGSTLALSDALVECIRRATLR
jgi:hypothetical protein